VWGLTFELTPTTEVGSVSLVRDDAPSAADQAYAACRSGSAVERGVMQHVGSGVGAWCCQGYRGVGHSASGTDGGQESRRPDVACRMGHGADSGLRRAAGSQPYAPSLG
jgi:hypothetical protein